MIHINGQGLQRKYSSGSSSSLKTNAQKSQQQKDRDALKKASLAKTWKHVKQEQKKEKHV